MKFSIYYLPLFLLLITFSACKKKGDPKPGTSAKAALLIKTWKVTKVTQTGQNTPVYQNPLPAGQSITEDYSRFRLAFTSTEYTITGKDGATKSGKWELASNDTKLAFDKGVAGSEFSYEVDELTSTSLKIRFTEASAKTGNRELLVEMTPE